MPLPLTYLEEDNILIQPFHLKHFPANFVYIPENTLALTDKNLNVGIKKKYSGKKNKSKQCTCDNSQFFTSDFKLLTEEGYNYIVNNGYEKPLSRCSDKRCKLNLKAYFESKKDRKLEIFFKNERIGWGVRTLNFIPQYSFIGEYVGWYEDPNASLEASPYIFQFGYNQYKVISDARRFGNYTRFVNHSCKPNILTAEVNNKDWCCYEEVKTESGKIKKQYVYDNIPQIWFIAERDIYPGEELFINYGVSYFANVDYSCLCGELNCMIYNKMK
uniref:SET domain-containing protein n=1 Tax=Parastrongyloides trichosuri TaxID=131310 RepID=A0A0N4ZT69_PARTI